MRILAVSAHPDDETLGCGGTLIKHRASGDSISWLIATVAHEPQWSAEVIRKKAAETDRVAAQYGIQQTYKLGLPTGRLDTVPQGDVMHHIGKAVEEARPEVVYLVHGGDIHTDHVALFNATMSVLKPFHMRRLGVRRVLSYEVLSSTEAAPPRPERAFIPQVFSDISATLEEKLKVLALYESEVQAENMPRHPSAVRALARYRGAAIGVEFAEAFMLIRESM
jgi:N-acetylglucosamine malate deacetylase 1